jgi:hypothetical protein
VFSGPALDVADFIAEAEALSLDPLFSRPPDCLSSHPSSSIESIVQAMELFSKLFGDLLVFVYHCFHVSSSRVISLAISRPEQVVYFFRQVPGRECGSKMSFALTCGVLRNDSSTASTSSSRA